MDGIYMFDPSHQTARFAQQANILQGTSIFVTAATSILATFLIGAHIYQSTSMNSRARRRYTSIVDIITQSSALYSFSLLAQAILGLVTNSTFGFTGSTLLNANTYTYEIATMTTVCSSMLASL